MMAWQLFSIHCFLSFPRLLSLYILKPVSEFLWKQALQLLMQFAIERTDLFQSLPNNIDVIRKKMNSLNALGVPHRMNDASPTLRFPRVRGDRQRGENTLAI